MNSSSHLRLHSWHRSSLPTIPFYSDPPHPPAVEDLSTLTLDMPTSSQFTMTSTQTPLHFLPQVPQGEENTNTAMPKFNNFVSIENAPTSSSSITASEDHAVFRGTRPLDQNRRMGHQMSYRHCQASIDSSHDILAAEASGRMLIPPSVSYRSWVSTVLQGMQPRLTDLSSNMDTLI